MEQNYNNNFKKVLFSSEMCCAKKEIEHIFCKGEKRQQRKVAIKSVKMQIFKIGFLHISNWSNVRLDSKFKAARMFDG